MIVISFVARFCRVQADKCLRIGIVEDYLPPKQRWRVRLGSGKSHDFKAENLQLGVESKGDVIFKIL